MTLEPLQINDVFYTIQGEGANAGRRSLFVRMPFCDLACSWCDTQFNTFTRWNENEFEKFASEGKCRFAVITGGEPTMHKHTPRVVNILKSLGYEIAIETNGHFPIPIRIDFVTVSPKRDVAKASQPPFYICDDAFENASEFKYVVDKGFDFGILDRHDVHDGKRYSLSPEFGSFQESVQRILDFIRENPEWRLSLQTHKWIGIP